MFFRGLYLHIANIHIN